ncbi:MAPEG family protein [Halobacteriovorax sp. RZ-1]|uniref:MAPEG family protein n=1 Tax=unclassified Halobacteriovorax TaxID=2639665 RepID=UPI00371D2B00
MEMEIFFRYCGVLGLLYVVVTLNVIRNRWKHRVGLGHGKVSDMNKAIRIHGNFSEYIPFILLLTYFAIEKEAISLMGIHILLAALIISRVSHFIGLTKSAGTSVYRFFGTSIILVSLIGISITLLR